jgi:hypothetical protein
LTCTAHWRFQEVIIKIVPNADKLMFSRPGIQITELPLQAGTLRVGDATALELETRIIRYNRVRTTSEDQ